MPSRPALWWWARWGADFVHFACFGFVFFEAGGGQALGPSVVGPFRVLILFILFVFGSFFGAGGGLALAPSAVVCPLGG